MTRSISLALLFSLALGCGGGTSETADGTDDGSGSESPAPRWDDVDLVTTVREGAVARIHEVEPGLDVAQLPAWAADPESAPDLGDRVAEQIIHLAIAAAAADEAELAVGLVRLVREKARNRNNAFTGTTLLSELARRASEDEAAQQAGIREVFAVLPRNRFGGATVVFQLFQNEGQIDARVERLHEQLVSLDTAVSVLFYDAILRPIVQHRELFLGVIEALRAEHEAQPEAAPYAYSTVDLTGAADAQPLVVAVWDTGVAGPLFESQLFTDGSGAHGVVADPTEGQTGLTYEPGEATVTEYAPFLQGIMDLRAGLASTEAAQRVLQLMGSAQDAAAIEALEVNLNAIGEWAHGTHVAGIMLAGVPQARLAVFRSAWAGEARLYHNRGPTDAELAAERANVEAIATFINDNHVRVINASLGFGRDYVEDQLRHESATYATDEAVRARAEVVHQHRTETWRQVIAACPEALFVVAAGNSNRDIVEYADVPAALRLPNLLTVGAVDRFGEWATFTNSNPEVVQVFDWGVEVPSLIPNGQTVPLSGTSMASPNVANLATKILAVAPTLGPAEVITIIRETGEPIPAPFYGRIAHEERALARARAARAH
ncbi:MAG: S8 family serine peptidase [Sandaracinaceae bacterium]|nr:S8 family serine peptidase [Sandaracinaceae bacterium]